MAPKVVPAEIRFWRFVDKDGPFCERLGSRCWLWTGGKSATPNGELYGRFRGHNSRLVPSHRFSWEMVNGPTDADAVDHLCRVTLCVNPTHLEPVTDRVNILRGAGLAAENAKKTTCPADHPYDGTYPDGRRYCKKCRTRDACRCGRPYDAVNSAGRRYCTACVSRNGATNIRKRWSRAKTSALT